MSERDGPSNRVGRPPRGERSPEDTREALLEATEALLSERGYAATSMQAVAKASGITKGTLYHHFPLGKDALIAEVGRRLLRRDEDGLASAAASAARAEARLVAMATWLMGHARRSERMLRDAVRFLPEALREEMSEGFVVHLYRHVERALVEGVERGELPPHDTAFAAWCFLGLVSEFTENPGLRRDPEAPARLVALVLRGVGAVPAPR